MSQDMKIIGGIGLATVIILVIGAFLLSNGGSQSNTSSSSQVDTAKADATKLVESDSYAIGAKNAPVTLVEFGDFQCPGCGAMYPVVKQLQQTYGNKMNFVFRNFPLTSLHKNALLAAQAAVAAGNQGKFWQMHDLLYQNQDAWAESDNAKSMFDTYAKQLNLNVSTFDQDIKANTTVKKIQVDIADGNSLRVNATPTFYINQHKYLGNYTLDDLKNAISAAIKKS